ncbi:unnamed protein product [Dovyalis caffra]|uniref:rRNA N-glycosylase n=1 Tax=Dovyalis caffra TaxID=77055 RepID=A0AAV1QTR1_9ROSI|nr:unnamed protein product [Dovyalis caffra]
MILPALVCPSVIEETKTLRYNTVTFKFEDATEDSYSAFVNSLRNEVKSKEVFGLPVTAKTAAIESVYGKPEDVNTEARFFIISIQMVSEAARFQYILNKVLEGGIYGSYEPDYKAISLENSWKKISDAIQTADPSGKFRSNITLKDADNKQWVVTQVSDIENDMGLLKFLETSRPSISVFSTSANGIFLIYYLQLETSNFLNSV